MTACEAMRRAVGVLLVLELARVVVPGRAAAQVAAPALIEEDLPAEEPAPPPAAEPAPPAVRESAPPAAPPPSEPAPLRAIEPVRSSYADLLAAWDARRRALREQDVAAARAAEARLLDLKRELGIEDLFALAQAELRAADRALAQRAPAEALARAELAAALAPDLPQAHLAVARARLAREPGSAAVAVRHVVDAAAALRRDPRSRRALLADVAAAGLLALAATAAAVLAVLFARRARLLLHDARHLPLLRHAAPAQAAFLAASALAAPLALRLGPAAFLAVLALAAAPWLERRERAVATAALLALGLLPAGAALAARHATFAGTLAEDVYLVERGADDGRAAARLSARAERGELPAPALLALARDAKRRGDLATALRWNEAAGPSRPAALVNAGNVRFLQGDLDAAKAAYLAATDRAGGDVSALAAAHYGLSKVYVRGAALAQAQEARRRAAAEDPALLERHGSDDDFRANRFLVDVPVPAADLAALAEDGAAAAVGAGARALLAGPVPAAAWPWALGGVALALWAAPLVRRRNPPCRACPRCGRTACARCDGAAAELCGQCLSVFSQRVAVDPRDRAAKERQVRRHARVARALERGLAVVGGGVAHLWRGEPVRGALLLLATAWLGACALVAARPAAAPWAPAWLSLPLAGAAAALAVLVWAAAARDVFRRRP